MTGPIDVITERRRMGASPDWPVEAKTRGAWAGCGCPRVRCVPARAGISAPRMLPFVRAERTMQRCKWMTGRGGWWCTSTEQAQAEAGHRPSGHFRRRRGECLGGGAQYSRRSFPCTTAPTTYNRARSRASGWQRQWRNLGTDMHYATDDAAAFPVSDRSGGIGRGGARTPAATTDAIPAIRRYDWSTSCMSTTIDEQGTAAERRHWSNRGPLELREGLEWTNGWRRVIHGAGKGLQECSGHIV